MPKLNKEQAVHLTVKLISYAGDSRNLSLKAIEYAQKGNFLTVKELLAQANSELLRAHKINAQILENEATGIEPEINTLFIQAQNHLANASIYNNLTKIIADLYIKIDKLNK